MRERLFEHVGATHGIDPLRLVIEGTEVVDTMGTLRLAVADASAGRVFDVRRALEARTAVGSPSPKNVRAQIARWKKLLK